MDVKTALIAGIDVDVARVDAAIGASTKTVLLKGSVPTAEQRSVAEAIARDQSKGYKLDNQRIVTPK